MENKKAPPKQSFSADEKNTQISAASPLSRGLAEQGSVGKASKLTAAAKNLGITETLPQLSDSVKNAICLFSDVADAIDNNTPVRGGKDHGGAFRVGTVS